MATKKKTKKAKKTTRKPRKLRPVGGKSARKTSHRGKTTRRSKGRRKNPVRTQAGRVLKAENCTTRQAERLFKLRGHAEKGGRKGTGARGKHQKLPRKIGPKSKPCTYQSAQMRLHLRRQNRRVSSKGAKRDGGGKKSGGIVAAIKKTLGFAPMGWAPNAVPR
jgi:hypothetical protein